MKKEYSLKKKSEIDAIFNKRQSVGNRYFVLYYDKQIESNFRFCLSIGTKYGNAVSRNKIKRQIRSIINLNQDQIDYDFVIVIKPNSNQLDFQTIKKEIEFLFFKKQNERNQK